jgi:nucleotide-binding universal stress UspA family protein
LHRHSFIGRVLQPVTHKEFNKAMCGKTINFICLQNFSCMKNILLPTDFSPSAYDTARYAIALAKDLKAAKIVLYNAYQPYVSEDPGLDTIMLQNIAEYKQISEEGLIKMKNTLEAEIPSPLLLEYESDYNTVTTGIESACKKHDAELVIMGITGADNGFEELLIGSNAANVSMHSKIPVISVPSGISYSGLHKVLLVLDFKKAAETTPVSAIKKLLDETNAQLYVVHVETNANNTEQIFNSEKNVLDTLFVNYTPQFHFIKGESFTDAVNSFADEHQADLIIVIPKRHGFFENIFKRSHTKALVFHSHIPVMAIHE